jgi:putative thioredoxin
MEIDTVQLTNFEEDVIEASYSRPILVNFWAEWCGPCKYMAPSIEKLAKDSDGAWSLVKVNTESNPSIATEWGIRGIPNLKLFFHGRIIDEVAGAMSAQDLKQWLTQKLPSEAKALSMQGQQLAIESNNILARQKFESALKLEVDLLEAKLGLARIELWTNPQRALVLVSQLPHVEQAAEITLIAEALILDQQTLAYDISKSDFLKGIKALNEQRFEDALLALIKAVKANKKYLNEFGRKLVIALFHYWGESHEITKKYRKKFDIVLY